MAVGRSESAMEITVSDPVKLGDGVNAYTSYRVTTKSPSTEGEVYVIRRFSDFEWLHDRVGDLYKGAIVPPLPDKNVLEKFRFTREFVESRRRGLESFINRLAAHPIVGRADELEHFLKDSEDTWTMEMRKTAETKVLGAKSSDLMHMFQSVQWSLASTLLGTEEVSEERETERLKSYADALDRCLADCHRDARQFGKRQRDLGASMCLFGASLQALGLAEGGEEGPVGRCFSEVGNKADIVGTATRNNAQVFLESLEEPLKEYVRLVQAIKKAISDRSAGWTRMHQVEAELKAKRGKRERAIAASVNQAKVEEIEGEVAEISQRVEASSRDHRAVSDRLSAELRRCHGEMAADFERMFREFKAVQVRIQRQSAHSWESLQPSIRAAAAALKQLPTSSPAPTAQ